jgi:hypothetical protein
LWPRGCGLRRITLLALILIPSIASAQVGEDFDHLETRIGLADLTAYRSALRGNATADDFRASDSPRPVSFPELWACAKEWQGRRVLITGKVARIFRQGSVGGFPPLVEAWLSTPAGDLLCIVFPEGESQEKKSSLTLGKQITFTGTFLRSIRYLAADQARLAPLIVGDRQPDRPAASADKELATDRYLRGIGGIQSLDHEREQEFESWSWGSWWIGLPLGLVAMGVLAWQHLRGPPVQAKRFAGQSVGLNSTLANPVLEFIESEYVNGPAIPDERSP